MFKGRFATVRYIVSFCVGGAITLMFLVLYLMIEEDSLDITKILYIAYGLLLAYFALFANQAINTRRHIANSSYWFLLCANIAMSSLIGFSIAISEEKIILNDLSRAYELTSIILSILTLVFIFLITILVVFKLEEKRRSRVRAVTHNTM